MRVGSLPLWRRANFENSRRTLCGDRACRIAPVVAPCESLASPANPLQVSCASNRSRCGAVRILNVNCEPSRCFWRAPALARGASCEFCSRSTTLSWFLAPCGAGMWSVCGILFAIDDPLVVFGPWRRWRVERLRNSVRDRRPSRSFRPLAALARGASSEFCFRDRRPSRGFRLSRLNFRQIVVTVQT